MNIHLRLIQKARSSGVLFFLVVLSGFASGGLVILQAWYLSQIVSSVFLQNQTLVEVLPLLERVLIVIAARVALTFTNETLAGKLTVNMKSRLREQLVNKISHLGPLFLKNERSAELAATALQGLDALDAYFGQFLPQILLAALLPLTILFVVFPLDLITGLVFLLTAPLIPLFMVFIGKLAQNRSKRQWVALTRLGAYFLDTLQGLTTLKSLGRSHERGDEIRSVSDRYRSVTLDVLRITFLSAFVLELIATLSTALVAVEIGLRLLYARMEFQQAFFILLIAPEFYLPLRNLSLRYHAGMTGVTAAQKMFDLLNTPASRSHSFSKSHSEPILANPFTITFEQVSFHYPDANQPVLQDISLQIQSGKRYALVGESGAGKSTLAYLFMKYLQPISGEIFLDAENIRKLDGEAWRKNIAWIPQTARLFHASLLENVRLYNPSMDRERVIIALGRAGLEGLLSRLPQGLDTPLLEEGMRLSGGEARRVILARAFIKDSPLVFMDEPSAYLDWEMESEIIDFTAKLLAGRTVLTIAHRLHTVKNVDHIFVLSHGRLVEQGTHHQLAGSGGEYARILGNTGEMG